MTQTEFNEMFLAAMAEYGKALENTTEIPEYSASDIEEAEDNGQVLTMPGVVYDPTVSGSTPIAYFQAPMSAFRAPAEAAAESAATAVAAMQESLNSALGNLHLDYIGNDFYVYRWSEANSSYYKTDIYLLSHIGSIYTKAEVDALIESVYSLQPVTANTLPTASAATLKKLYLIPNSGSDTGNYKNEYITIATTSEGVTTYSWELLGTTHIDISGKLDEISQEDFNAIFD